MSDIADTTPGKKYNANDGEPLEVHINKPDLSIAEIDRNARALLYRSLNTGRLIAFLGSGISVAYGQPTWKQLVIKLARAAIEEFKKFSRKRAKQRTIENGDSAGDDESEKYIKVRIDDLEFDDLSKKCGVLNHFVPKTDEPKLDDEFAKTAVLQLSEEIFEKLGETNKFRELAQRIFTDDKDYTLDRLIERLERISEFLGPKKRRIRRATIKHPEEYYRLDFIKKLKEKLTVNCAEKHFLEKILEEATIFTTYAFPDHTDGSPGPILPPDRRSFFTVLVAMAIDLVGQGKIEKKHLTDIIEERIKATKADKKTKSLKYGSNIRATIDPLDYLFRGLEVNRYLTTNYDLLIERYLESLDYPFDSFTDFSDINHRNPNPKAKDFNAEALKFETTISRTSRSGRESRSMVFRPDSPQELIEFAAGAPAIHTDVLHLHGRILENDPMVLTERDYQRHYHRDMGNRNLVDDSMSLVFGANPLLFIGVGLSESDFLSPLRRFVSAQEDRKDRPIFALMPILDDKPSESRTAETITQYNRYGLYVMHYGEAEKEKSKKKLIGLSLAQELKLLRLLKNIFAKIDKSREGETQAQKRRSSSDTFFKMLLNYNKSLAKSVRYKKKITDWDIDPEIADKIVSDFFRYSSRIRIDRTALAYLIYKASTARSETDIFIYEQEDTPAATKPGRGVGAYSHQNAVDFIERLEEKVVSVALIEKLQTLSQNWRNWWQRWLVRPISRYPDLIFRVPEKATEKSPASLSLKAQSSLCFVRHMHNVATLSSALEIDKSRYFYKEAHVANLDAISSFFAENFSETPRKDSQLETVRTAYEENVERLSRRLSNSNVPLLMTFGCKDGVGSGRLLNEMIKALETWAKKPTDIFSGLGYTYGHSLFINPAFSEEFSSVFDTINHFVAFIAHDNSINQEKFDRTGRHNCFADNLKKAAENPGKRHLIVFSHFDVLLDTHGLPYSSLLEEFFWAFDAAAKEMQKLDKRVPIDILFFGEPSAMRAFSDRVLKNRFYKDGWKYPANPLGFGIKLNEKINHLGSDLAVEDRKKGISDLYKKVILNIKLPQATSSSSIPLPEAKEDFLNGFYHPGTTDTGEDKYRHIWADRLEGIAPSLTKWEDEWKQISNAKEMSGLIYEIWRQTGFSYYSLLLIFSCIRETFFFPNDWSGTEGDEQRPVGFFKAEPLKTWLERTRRAVGNTRKAAAADYVLMHVLERYLGSADNPNFTFWRVLESLNRAVLRHVAAIHHPVTFQTLYHAPEIQSFYKLNKRIIKPLGLKIGENLSALLQESVRVLERRCLLLPVHPHNIHDGAKKRYAIHRSLYRYIERQHGVRSRRGAERNFYDLNNFLAAPADMVPMTKDRFKLLTELIDSLIKAADGSSPIWAKLAKDQKEIDGSEQGTVWLDDTGSTVRPELRGDALRAAVGVIRTNFNLSVLSQLRDVSEEIGTAQDLLYDHQHRLRQLLEIAKSLGIHADGKAGAGWLYDEEIAWLFNERAILGYAQGNYFDAQPLSSQAHRVILRYSSGDRSSPTQAMQALNHALILIDRGRLPEAEKFLDNLAHEHSVSETLGQYLRKGLLGRVHHLQGRTSVAIQEYDYAIKGLEKLNRPRGISFFSRLQAQLLAIKEDVRGAKQSISYAVAAAERFAQEDMLHYARVVEALIEFLESEAGNGRAKSFALAKINSSLDYAEKLGQYDLQTRCSFAKAQIVLTLGDTKAAGELARDGLMLAIRHGMKLMEAKGLVLMGHVSLLRRESEIGLDLVRQGHEKAARIRYQLLVERAQQLKVAADSGDFEKMNGEVGFRMSAHSYIGF